MNENQEQLPYETMQNAEAQDNNTIENNTAEDQDSPQVISRIEDIEPLDEEMLYGRVLNSLFQGEFDYTNEQIYDLFAEQFGADFSWQDLSQDVNDERTRSIAEKVLQQQLDNIKSTGTTLVAERLNKSLNSMMQLIGLNVDLSQFSNDTSRAIFKQRAGQIQELMDAYAVLECSRRLFDLYEAGGVLPEINADVLKMQDFYRNGVIGREILAWYYYDVAMVYEKYSVQKNSSQAIYKEHYRSIDFMKKALDKTENNIGLIMNIRDVLSVEPSYEPQKMLDACHRIMDNASDNRSLYLAHKLYAETLSNYKTVGGFSQSSEKRRQKVVEHYRIALGYVSALEDKLDILENIAEQHRNTNKKEYIHTKAEIADLMNGRSRIRALKNLEVLVENPEAKVVILKSAINEFVDLKEVRREDVTMYFNLDNKLRKLAADKPETIKVLDRLSKKFKPKTTETKDFYFSQMSSRGHDIFSSQRKNER